MKKKILSLILAICLIIPCSLFLTACGSGKLSNDSGFKLEGGGFEKGSVLNSNKIESTSEDAGKIYDKLESFGVAVTDKSKAVIYDIYVSKDDKKVQPSGKVKVSVKIEENANGYKVYHVKDDDTVEELKATYDDGVLTFETESFSYYVFVPTGLINPIQTAGSEAEWNNAINYWKAQNNVKVVERISSPHNAPDTGAQIMIYQFKDNAYSEDGYFENAEESKKYKGKASYFVKESEDKYSYIYWGSSSSGECWVKNPDITKMEYEGRVNNIYGCSDLNGGRVDFSYSRFSYEATSKTYKYNDDNNIKVAFEFESGNLSKITITSYRESDEMTFTSTITFGNAEVDVPEVSE